MIKQLMVRLSIAALALLAPGIAAAQGFDQSHKAWDALVKKHVVVTQGGKVSQVRYAELA